MVPIHKLDTSIPVFPKKQYSILSSFLLYVPNPDKLSRSQRSGDPARGVAAKRKSRFIGELNIED
jgi:hypothetical protein